ncbi:MAG: FIST N-terminal domain-containing protein [Planctomycetota bacterium]|nr:FIST N-terminal domain-containing protein [Planctomycetota bacterium]
MQTELGAVRAAVGVASDPDTAIATATACQVCEQRFRDAGASRCDLALVFASAIHAPLAPEIAATVRASLSPRCLLGCSSEAIIAGRTELESSPGVVVMALSIPGAQLTPFTGPQVAIAEDDDTTASRIEAAFNASAQLRGVIMLADPFSMPVSRVLPAINRVLGPLHAPLIGGFASGANQPGQAALMLDQRIERAGAVGVAIASPRLEIDVVVSQGCRPIGPNFVITRARQNAIFELGGRPAGEVIRDVIASLPPDERATLKQRGIMLGRVINEYKDRFGRSDYLIRGIHAFEHTSGALLVGDMVRVGQTVRFHMQDAATARQDLDMLLDAQKLRERPAAGLLVTCNGRGRRMFGRPHADADAVARAFQPPEAGESLARGGEEIGPEDGAGPLPVAGFFAAGEIAPVGGECFLHGQTACVAFFRDRTEAARQTDAR